MPRLRDQRGSALVIAIVVVATMAVLGTATLSIVNAQTDQTGKQRTGESTFNLAEATLNAQAFLLARDWPQAVNASSCSSTTVNGTLAMPASTAMTVRDQVQRVLAQTYANDSNAATAQWWVTICAEGGRDSWDSSLLNGPSYDSSAASTGPRRMWVRAEARVAGRKRAVVALVQAGQAPVFPNLALVTGTIGGDLGSTLTNLTNAPLVGSLLGALLNQTPMFVGNIGLRCTLLDASNLLGCLSGVFALTSSTPLGPLLQANNYVHYNSDHITNTDQVAQLRRQAQQSGTYYATSSVGVGGVANNAACLPANSAGKVIFIEQIGDGTGTCILNTAANPSAKALIIGSGGVQVQGGGRFTGVINTMRGKALAGGVADVRISGGSEVSGGVFADDNSALGSNRHGEVEVIVPAPNLCSALGLLQLVCNLLGLNGLINALGGVITPLLPQLSPYLPAITYNAGVVSAVTTFNDSAIVAGTFRQVAPMY
jgi:hypothetical protein